MSSSVIPPRRAGSGLDADRLVRIYESMVVSRSLDEREEILKRQNLGMFQLSARGHEAMAAIAEVVEDDDLLFPHYRDRALMIALGVTSRAILDEYFGKAASSSIGRQLPSHYSCRDRNVVSISSPVGTQFLQAAGAAEALRSRSPGAVVIAHTGDASAAQGEVYEALALAAHDRVPVVFGIEDNHFGISTCTRDQAFWRRDGGLSVDASGGESFLGMPLLRADGRDPEDVYAAAFAAVARARDGEGPTLVVYDLDRLSPHSSSDSHHKYRTGEDLDRMTQRDPVVMFGRSLVSRGVLKADRAEEIRATVRERIAAEADAARAAPDPPVSGVADHLFAPPPSRPARSRALSAAAFPKTMSKRDGGLDMVAAINRALAVSLEEDDRVRLFGEDIEDPKGGVFGLTAGLSTASPARVRNSPLAEATIAGVGVGMAVAGLRPVFELQFVDFMGPAWNQISNEMATMSWRSGGQWTCPLVLIAPCGGYLPGGALWHSQTAEAYFLHTPGLRVVMPSTPADAYGLLRAAIHGNDPVIFLAPKHLFHQPIDLCLPPGFDDFEEPLGRARIVRQGTDLTIVAWGNAAHLAMAAARSLHDEGIEAEVVDLRSLNPFDEETVVESVRKTSRLMVVHEDNMTCGFGAEIIARMTGRADRWELLDAYPARVTRPDVHVPYNATLENSVQPDPSRIAEVARALARY